MDLLARRQDGPGLARSRGFDMRSSSLFRAREGEKEEAGLINSQINEVGRAAGAGLLPPDVQAVP